VCSLELLPVGAPRRNWKQTLLSDGYLVVRHPDLESCLRMGDRVAELPPGLAVERSGAEASFAAPEGLRLSLVERPDGVEYDLDHVAFLVPEPEQTFAELAGLGFDVQDDRLLAGGAEVRLERGDPGETGLPLLNHLGLRVESAELHIEEAEERGLEIADVVDAPNTYAVFLWGPDGIKLEYVEHKPTFSLT
jgi:hypothetical protein